MIYPQEIEVWYLLPAIRRELSKFLVNDGLTQREIASKLGITEAAVSQYLKEKRGNEVSFDEKMKNYIRISSKRIILKGEVMKEVEKIISFMRKTRFICGIHHKYDSSLPKNCEICIYEK